LNVGRERIESEIALRLRAFVAAKAVLAKQRLDLRVEFLPCAGRRCRFRFVSCGQRSRAGTQEENPEERVPLNGDIIHGGSFGEAASGSK
jgi:hypothetical protein